MILRNSKVVLSAELQQAEGTDKLRSQTLASRKEEKVSNEARNANTHVYSASTKDVKQTPMFPVQVFDHFKNYLRHLATFLLTAAVILMACSLRGDVALVVVFFYKSYIATVDKDAVGSTSSLNNSNSTEILDTKSVKLEYVPMLPDYLQIPDEYNLKDLLFYVMVGVVSSQVMYQGICGFLQLYFYTLKRGKPEEWKCQPHRFLTRSNEIHEMVVGTVNMTIAGFVSGFLTCWVVNGNYSTVYFDIAEYGYIYFFSSFALLFLWFEAAAFYSHALLHTPWFYKNCHKQHHRYHSPTAYSVIAMSPFEMAFYDSLMIAPLFLFPIHGAVYVVDLVYVYYFGLMDHSGIKMTSWFPWQPDTMFHDDHHKYFHVNFGFNSRLFDWLHGTLRRPDREYGEDIFGGKGREKVKK